MKPINKIFEYLKESNLTMIGYKYQDERIKDELISKLPHIEIFEFDSSFSVMSALKRTIRDKKIGSVLDGEEFSNTNFLVVDLGNFSMSKSESAFERSRHISEFVGQMRKEVLETKYSLIILSPVNSTMGSALGNDIPSFSGGNRSIYMADMAYVIEGRKIKIIKNRFDGDNITISLDNLKDYKYICSYENNK
jgi:hypothetical protein